MRGGPPATVLAGRLAMFSAMRYPNYRLYWFGQFPSVLAWNMQHVAMAWLVFHLTNSPAMLGISGLAQTVPNIAISMVAGAMADRWDRKRLLIITQSSTALIYLALGVLASAEAAHVGIVLVLAFTLGCVRAFDSPSRQALLPMIVPREVIPTAVPLGDLIWQGSRLVGPATAGLLIALVGIGHTFYVGCAGFLVAAVMFSRIKMNDADAKRATAGLWRNVLDGMGFIRSNELISALIWLTYFNSVFGMAYVVMLPVFARDILHVGPMGFGFLETAGGLGSIAGSFFIAAVAQARWKGQRIILGAAVFGLLIVAFAASTSYLLSLGILFLMGLANQMYMTTINTTLQLNLPNEFRGRVMGVWGLGWSLTPLGGTFAGAIAEVASVPIALAIGGILVALMALLLGALAPRVRHLE
ncbi:MAG: transporter [Chloroflexi bacterium]|nr:transporter [Chloroflexota bacterium]